MSLRQAAQRALKAMEDGEDRADMIEFSDALIALRAALAEPEQNPFGDDAERYARKLHEEREAYKAFFIEHKPEQEPVATKQMLRWVEHLKRLSDDGQHMSIPGLSSGACWELAIELEQFIKNTAPTPRKPLTDEMVKRMKEVCTSMEMRGAFADGWLSAEAAHGIGEQQ